MYVWHRWFGALSVGAMWLHLEMVDDVKGIRGASRDVAEAAEELAETGSTLLYILVGISLLRWLPSRWWLFNPQTSRTSVRLCLLALLHINKALRQCFILGFVVYRIHAFRSRCMDLPRFVARTWFAAENFIVSRVLNMSATSFQLNLKQLVIR